jgi:hypothetical protein
MNSFVLVLGIWLGNVVGIIVLCKYIIQKVPFLKTICGM